MVDYKEILTQFGNKYHRLARVIKATMRVTHKGKKIGRPSITLAQIYCKV